MSGRQEGSWAGRRGWGIGRGVPTQRDGGAGGDREEKADGPEMGGEGRGG